MIDDKDQLIAALKLRLGGTCCEVCWTNSWVPIESEADANGVNIMREADAHTNITKIARCDFCWQEWATGQVVRQSTEAMQKLAKQYADMKTYAEFLEKKYGHKKEAP